jgi:hypothetical protein
MPYKVSGLLNKTARIIAINEENWAIESNTTKSGGAYSVTGLSVGLKTVIAICDGDAPLIFQHITPIVHDTQATGGIITYSGEYRIHTFTSSNQLNVVNGGNFEYLIVGGGGGGGTSQAGGGGGGGMLTGTVYNLGSGIYTITVGTGGPEATNGNNSSALGITVYGGGAGGNSGIDGNAGGCGGGGGVAASRPGNTWYYPIGGSGISGQGYRGGNAYQGQNIINGPGGGGGAGAHGNDNAADVNSHGGVGRLSSITGSAVYYGGGGGGGRGTINDHQGPGNGGTGGGGRGNDGYTYGSAGAGTDGLGGGGGGGSFWYDHGDRTHGANGGSGIVIVRYLYEGVH